MQCAQFEAAITGVINTPPINQCDVESSCLGSIQVQTKNSGVLGLPTEWPKVFRVDSHAAFMASDSQHRAGPHIVRLT